MTALVIAAALLGLVAGLTLGTVLATLAEGGWHRRTEVAGVTAVTGRWVEVNASFDNTNTDATPSAGELYFNALREVSPQDAKTQRVIDQAEASWRRNHTAHVRPVKGCTECASNVRVIHPERAS